MADHVKFLPLAIVSVTFALLIGMLIFGYAFAEVAKEIGK